jgi:hypothetical protein
MSDGVRRRGRYRSRRGVNELGKLEVAIPRREPSFDREAFLASHPECVSSSRRTRSVKRELADTPRW